MIFTREWINQVVAQAVMGEYARQYWPLITMLPPAGLWLPRR